MRYLILILCLVQFRVEASDWLNRTIRVDLHPDQNSRAFVSRYDLSERFEIFARRVDATNGQFPWTILIIGWRDIGSPHRTGMICSGTIISSDFVLSDSVCVGVHMIGFNSTVFAIDAFIGSVNVTNFPEPSDSVRHFWYIEPSIENSPGIALLRMHKTITFNPNIHPIRLPHYKDFAYDSWSSLMLGFDLRPILTHQLQSMHTSIFDNSLCHFNDSDIADHEICGTGGDAPIGSGPAIRFSAFTGGAWIVYEYTGAGLEFIPVLIGVHQYHYFNETASYLRASRVSHFMEWIEELVQEGDSCGCPQS